MRLQKYLARSGVASRRNSEKIIEQGRVSVNGLKITKLGTSVQVGSDLICVDGKEVHLIVNKFVLALNKPIGYVTTMSDPQGRKTVGDLVDNSLFPGVFPVGRLDINTSGLLLMTNDGDLAAKLMHPSSNVKKTYVVAVKGNVDARALDCLRCGVDIGDFITSPAEVKLIRSDPNVDDVNLKTLEIKIHEGKNRQVRKMCSSVGLEVVCLKRTKYANITLDGLSEGEVREIKGKELELLHSFV